MGRLGAAITLLVALAAVLLLAACGSDGDAQLLPGTTADQIESNLDFVRESKDAGNCEEAEVAVAEVGEEIDDLQKVDGKLKAALEAGTTRLSEVLATCGAGIEAEERLEDEEEEADEEQEQLESEEAQAEEEAALEKTQKAEEAKEEADEKAKAEKQAEQPGPAQGPEEAEEVEPPGEEEVTPPVEEGDAGGIGPGSAVEGGP